MQIDTDRLGLAEQDSQARNGQDASLHGQGINSLSPFTRHL